MIKKQYFTLQQYLKMANRHQKSGLQTKKTAALINKFNYYLQNTLPEHFSEQIISKISSNLPKIHTKKGIRGMTFHFVDHLTEGVEFVDEESILLSAKKVYLGVNSLKINQNMYKNYKITKGSFLPFSGIFTQMLQFCIFDKSEVKNSLASSRILFKTGKSDQKEPQLPTAKHYPKKNNDNFQFYVIHHCYLENSGSAENMKWETFIQKYHFRHQIHRDQLKPILHYNLIFNYEEDHGFLGFFSLSQSLYQQFIDSYLVCKQGQLQIVNLLQSQLLKLSEKVSKKLQILNDPAFDQAHKRFLKYSPQQQKMYLTLKNHAANQQKLLYGYKQHFSDLTLSSLVCRYMIAKEYDFTQCYNHLIEYLKWQKKLYENFNLLMFQKFHKLDFFTYLGNDFQGRAVVLNKASRLTIQDIDSVEDYCNYYSYFLQIFVARRFRGYADQMLIIADLTELSSDNFKFSITKRNLDDALKFCPERQFKLIVFNLAGFATTLWKLFNYMLPKRSLSKVSIVGEDKGEILDVLRAEMDISVIPEYLGGKNKRSYLDDLQDEAETLKNRQ